MSDWLNNEINIKRRLIIKLSFELTFWIQIEIELNCSHFQLDSSLVAHIFNLTRLNSTENWVNSTWLVKNLSLMSRELNIENFPSFDFCIIFLHYLLIESHEEEHEEKHEEKTWRSFNFDRKSWRKNMVESHEENHEDCSIKLFTSI